MKQRSVDFRVLPKTFIKFRLKQQSVMKNEELKKLEGIELESNDLTQTRGGFIVPLMIAVGTYLLYDIAGNPQASVDAFLRGWNFAKNS
jgi:hypothetical protein